MPILGIQSNYVESLFSPWLLNKLVYIQEESFSSIHHQGMKYMSLSEIHLAKADDLSNFISR